MLHPSSYCSDLTEDRLVFIATKMLEQVDLTYDTNSNKYDCSYTIGSVIFGRVKNMLIHQCSDSQIDWLSDLKLGNDLVFKIGMVPCRFATDDPDSPNKNHILKQSLEELEQLGQIPFPFDEDNMLQDSSPSKWRWVIRKAYSDIEDPSIHLLGLNRFDQPICRWDYKKQAMVLFPIDGTTPKPKNAAPAPARIPPAKVRLKSVKGGKGSTNEKDFDTEDHSDRTDE